MIGNNQLGGFQDGLRIFAYLTQEHSEWQKRYHSWSVRRLHGTSVSPVDPNPNAHSYTQSLAKIILTARVCEYPFSRTAHAE